MAARDVDWKANTASVLASFPKPVKERFVQDIEKLRYGILPVAKPLNGLGKGVYELRRNGKPAYRLVYVVIGKVIHILHVFVIPVTIEDACFFGARRSCYAT